MLHTFLGQYYCRKVYLPPCDFAGWPGGGTPVVDALVGMSSGDVTPVADGPVSVTFVVNG